MNDWLCYQWQPQLEALCLRGAIQKRSSLDRTPEFRFFALNERPSYRKCWDRLFSDDIRYRIKRTHHDAVLGNSQRIFIGQHKATGRRKWCETLFTKFSHIFQKIGLFENYLPRLRSWTRIHCIKVYKMNRVRCRQQEELVSPVTRPYWLHPSICRWPAEDSVTHAKATKIL